MTIIKAQKTPDHSRLELTQLDINAMRMVNKGIWVFKEMPDTEKIKDALSIVLNHYPHFAGRVVNGKEISLNNEGVDFEVKTDLNVSIADIAQIKKPNDYFNKGLKASEFIKGKVSPVSIRLTRIKDATVLSVHCAHGCADGNSFYKFVSDWAAIARDKTFAPPLLQLKSDILEQIYTKEETLNRLQEKGWKKITPFTIIKFVWRKLTKINNHTAVIHLPDTLIEETREKIEKASGVRYGRHVVLSAMVSRMVVNLNSHTNKERYTQISVADLREKIKEIPEAYNRNAVNAITTEEFEADLPVHEIANKIDQTIKAAGTAALKEELKLFISVFRHKIAYNNFSIDAVNGKHPTGIYVNNFLKFHVYDIDFGKGTPVLVLPNDLTDLIKFWPSAPGKDGIDIYLNGYIAKRYKSLREKKRDNIFIDR